MATELTQVADRLFVGGSQDTAYGRHVGEHVETKNAFNERVVFVESDITHAAVSGKGMHDEQQHDASVGENG